MKSVAITLGILIAALSMTCSLQAGSLVRVEATRQQVERQIERTAAMQHRMTPIWNIPAHIMIELEEAAKKRANDRAAAIALQQSARRRTLIVPRIVKKPVHRAPIRRRTNKPVFRPGDRRW